MIVREKVVELVRAQLTQATEDVVKRLVDDIIRDTEYNLYSLIRQSVAHERENTLVNQKDR